MRFLPTMLRNTIASLLIATAFLPAGAQAQQELEQIAAAIEAGELREARRLVGEVEESMNARLLLAQIERESGDPEAAIATLEAATAAYPDAWQPWMDLGTTLAFVERYERAIDAFQEAANRTEELAPRIAVARTYSWSGNTVESERHFRHLLEVAPDYAEVHLGMAALKLQTEELERAELHFERAQELGATEGAQAGLAQIAALRADRASQAEAARLETVAMENLQRAEHAIHNDDYALARSILSETPDSLNRRLLQGRAEREAGETEAAVAILQEATEDYPADWQTWMDLGTTLAFAHRFEEAISAYERATQVTDEVAPRLALARTLAWAGELDASEAVYLEVLEAAPESAEVHLGLGDLNAQRLRRSTARQHYERARELGSAEAADEGLQRLLSVRRVTLSLSQGVAMIPEEPTRWVGSLGLRIRLDPQWELQMMGGRRAGTFATTVALEDRSARHQGALGLAWQNERAVIGLTYSFQHSEARMVHRAELAAALLLGDVTLSASTRPGIDHEGQLEHLGQVGLLWAPSALQLQAQVFRADGPNTALTTFVGTVGMELGFLNARAGGSATLGAQTFGSVFGSIGFRIHRSHLLFSAEWLSLSSQTSLTFTYEVAL